VARGWMARGWTPTSSLQLARLDTHFKFAVIPAQAGIQSI